MKEISQILEAYKNINFSTQQAALATVVHVEGSSYRRPGARMLITDNGNLTGAISGGCLEGDALRKALLVMHQKKPMVVTYDTTDDDDAKVGIGLGCNGIIHILIEPILPEKLNNPLELLLQAKSIRQKAVLATLFSLKNKKALQPGTCILYASGKITGSLDVSLLDQDVTGEMQKAYDLTQSRLKEFRQLTGFIQVLQPTLRLVIFGAGNDVIPLTEMAAVLGWETVVIDGRATHAKAERFPLSSGVIVAKPGAAVTLVESDEQTYFLLMTHNYNYDLEIFKSLVLQDVKYIGVLGPKKKLQQMVEEAGSSDMSNVYGPVGLDIGAETAEEIALSIISEIKAVSSASEGGSLRNKPEPIHSFSTLFSS